MFAIHKKRILYVILAMSTIPAILFMFVVFKPARAVSIILRPTSDGSVSEWTPTPSGEHFLTIDDGVVQPLSGDILDYIKAPGSGRNGIESDEFLMDTRVSDTGKVNQLDIWLYATNISCRGTGLLPCDQLEVKVSARAASSSLNILAIKGIVTPAIGSYSWLRLTFITPDGYTIPFREAKDLKIKITRIANGGGGNNDEIRVATLYAEVSYNPDFVYGGGGPLLESTTTSITRENVTGANNFDGGKRQRSEGEPENVSVPIETGATIFGGGVETP